MKRVFLVVQFLLFSYFSMQAQNLYPNLAAYCQSLSQEFSQIPEQRKENLKHLAAFIQEKNAQQQSAYLTFICTHNSRRSQLGQVWAKVAAHYYGFSVESFSGGTEATACNIRTVKALQRAGLNIALSQEDKTNPRYKVQWTNDENSLVLFSKKYNDESNPQKDFCAILVCSQADEACPLVHGAAQRIYQGFEDPKRSDDSPQESQIYDEACREIAREIFYAFSLIAKE